MGYDPTGNIDWGGWLLGNSLVVGTLLVLSAVASVTPVGALVACAVMATGYIMAETAKDDGVMVMDFSHSVQVGPGYVKDGGSLVIDFEADEVNYYSHHGGGMGWSEGFSYSVGEVRNYTSPNDYAGPFVNCSGGYYVGYDDCWDPRAGRESGTGAGSVTFSTGFGAGTGSDYYSTPTQLLKW